MELSEKDVEEMIFEAASTERGREFLHGRGLAITGTLFQQVNLGNFGVADLISITPAGRIKHEDGHSHKWRIDIYELKKNAIGVDALGQALRYREALKVFLFDRVDLRLSLECKVHLIGDSIDKSKDFLSYAKAMPWIVLYEYTFDYHGIHFWPSVGSDYERPDVGMPPAKLFNKRSLRAIIGQELTYDYRTQ